MGAIYSGFLYVVKLIAHSGDPLKSAEFKRLAPLLGFQASLLKLLPEVLLTILIRVLSEAGSSENSSLL